MTAASSQTSLSVRRHFVAMPSEIVRDDSLSFAAVGVLAEMLSRPQGWRFSAERIARERPNSGRDAVRAAMRELEAAGYVRRVTHRTDLGRIHTVVEVTDVPHHFDVDPVDNYGDETATGVTDDGNPVAGVTSGNTASPQVAPMTGSPAPGNPSSKAVDRVKETLTRARASGHPSATGASSDPPRSMFPTNRSADLAACAMCADTGWTTNAHGHAVKCTHPEDAQPRPEGPDIALARLRAIRAMRAG